MHVEKRSEYPVVAPENLDQLWESISLSTGNEPRFVELELERKGSSPPYMGLWTFQVVLTGVSVLHKLDAEYDRVPLFMRPWPDLKFVGWSYRPSTASTEVVNIEVEVLRTPLGGIEQVILRPAGS